jgi:hypothetical protein
MRRSSAECGPEKHNECRDKSRSVVLTLLTAKPPFESVGQTDAETEVSVVRLPFSATDTTERSGRLPFLTQFAAVRRVMIW